MTQLQSTQAPERPFLDWPVVTDPAGWNAKVALLGIQHSEPYSHDTFPNDQARAPDAVRAMSPSFCYNPAHWDFDSGSVLASSLPSHVDMGNVGWDGKDYGDYAARIADRVRHLWKQGTQVYVLGGDHGVTIPVVDALDALGEPVHILHIDAHLDWREEVGGVRRGYSSPLQWASKNPAVTGMTQIGLRAVGSARSREIEAARSYGSHLVSAEQFHAEGPEPVLATRGAPSISRSMRTASTRRKCLRSWRRRQAASISASSHRFSARLREATGSWAWTSSRSRRPTTSRTA
jgi:agmatinase